VDHNPEMKPRKAYNQSFKIQLPSVSPRVKLYQSNPRAYLFALSIFAGSARPPPRHPTTYNPRKVAFSTLLRQHHPLQHLQTATVTGVPSAQIYGSKQA
jgi:hypothetical protein